ncbi:MAG: hypothetical protein A4E64_00932 [Syntrophorhabdus sp. PtaU1.Bin058]|nr:MAG: hypothetical protein A4E64_00932 [Syntrophorhabdus sp. PtaU1.Bin058]
MDYKKLMIQGPILILFLLFLLIVSISFSAIAQPLPFGDVPAGVVRPSFGCGAVVTDEVSGRKCAIADLRYIDRRMNTLYHALRKELKPGEASAVSSTQREWIRRRDALCSLDAKKRSRESWLRYVAKSITRTSCVLKATEKRVAELEEMEYQLDTPPVFATTAPTPEKISPMSGELTTENDSTAVGSFIKSMRSHHNGKYYFEVLIEQAGIPKKLEADLIARVSDGQRWFGVSFQLRPRNLVLHFDDKSSVTIVGGDMGKLRLPKMVIGIAADLDTSRLYYHYDGVWQNDALPGSPKGIELSPGAEFMAELSSNVELAPLVQKGIVKINFGDSPFETQLPVGYNGFDAQKTVSGTSRSAVFPAVYSPRGHVAGSTQIQWIQRYWEWIRSFTLDDSPSADTSGYRCGAGQSGPVWFLTGSRKSASIKRECQVPEGKIILVPVLNVLAQSKSTEQTDCDRLHVSLHQYGSSVTDLRIKVDGVPMKGPESFFLGTGCFRLRDAASGNTGLAVGTGYWVFIKPLKKGRHEIEFGGRYPADNYAQDIKYVLYIQ